MRQVCDPAIFCSFTEVAEQSGGERGLLAHTVREMLAPLSGE